MEINKSKMLDTIYVIAIDIIKNIIPVLCVALSAVMMSYVFLSATYIPKYTSSCTMIVAAKINNTGVYTDTSETEKLTDTITAVMTSTVLKNKTAQTLGLSSFDGSVRVSVIPNTNMLELSVTSSNPNIAFRQLNTLLEVYPDVSRDILGKIVMEVFEHPSFPSYPSNPLRFKKTFTFSFLGGAGAVIVLLFVFSYYKDTIKNKWDIGDKLDAKLTAVIYHEKTYLNFKARLMRNKKRLLMGAAGVSFNFCETIKKLRTNVSYFMDKTNSKIILVTSYDNKEGKTTIAANLAYAMAQRKQKVLVISGGSDPTPLLKILNINLPRKTAANTSDSFADRIFTKHDTTLSVLANLSTDSSGNISKVLLSENFRIFLSRAKEVFDCIIIDGPAVKYSADAEVWARMSDFSILAVKQNLSTSIHLNDTTDMLNNYNNGLMGCIFNNVHSSAVVININYGYGYHYGYSRYGSYGKYRKYSDYKRYGHYGHYGYNHYNQYNHYNHYGPESAYLKSSSKR